LRLPCLRAFLPRRIFTFACLSSIAHTFSLFDFVKMITSCSYDFRSLSSLRSQAILPLHYASAVELNIWLPYAQKNAAGQTQPFPFADYINGIGTITTKYINDDSSTDMSWDAPAEEGSWGATEAQPELSTFAVQDDTTPTIAEVVATDEPAGELTAAASPTTSEVRKSSLADLTNGDRDAINSHLANGWGPHKLLSRFTSQKPDAELTVPGGHVVHIDASEPDGAASVVDESISNSAVVDKDESIQTAPDIPSSNLMTGTTPTGSVADGAESSTQSPHLSPRSVRKPGPHHRLKALAQDIPLPQSPAPIAKSATSDEGPETPLVSTIELEPVILQDSPSATPAADDGNESDVSSLAYEAFKTELPDSLHDKDKNLDSKAQNPVLNPEAVDYLPLSRSTSPTSMTKNAVIDSESILINDCCPVPGAWSVANVVEHFAFDDIFDNPMLGNISEKVLTHYSHYFAIVVRDGSDEKKEELVHVIKHPCFAVFRLWVYGRELGKATNDAVSPNKHTDLKTLVQLLRFAGRIQAPLFANVVADAIIAKTIAANDVSNAAEEIDTILKMVSVNHTFRLVICHAVILSGIQLDQDYGETWPQSLLLSVLACLDMGRNTYSDIEVKLKTDPCISHLHPLGRECSTV
jgi:hypothetical protein